MLHTGLRHALVVGALAALVSSSASAAQHRSFHHLKAGRHHASPHHTFTHHRRRFDTLVEASDAAGGETGRASYYAGRSHRTAGGGAVGTATCAHRTLPFGTKVLITNLANALQAVVTVNDRGPFVRGRIVDLSLGAAGRLGMLQSGIATVRLKVLGGPG